MSSARKLWEADLLELKKEYKVKSMGDDTNKIIVEFHGPLNSPYQNDVWYVKVQRPDAYPCRAPSVVIMNKLFHPYVSELSGSLIMDLLNLIWTPSLDLVDIFTDYLPQLLMNPQDALNHYEANAENEPKLKGIWTLSRLAVISKKPATSACLAPQRMPLIDSSSKLDAACFLSNSTY